MELHIEILASQSISLPAVVPLSRVLNLNKSQLTIFSDFDMACLQGDSSAVLSIIKSAFPPKATKEYKDNPLEDLSAGYKEEFAHCMKGITAGIPGSK